MALERNRGLETSEEESGSHLNFQDLQGSLNLLFKARDPLRPDRPFGLVKTSGSSRGGEHSAAVKMEASKSLHK